MSCIPNALSIAGVDPSGGAGIYADLKTFSALGVFGAGVVTALTIQNTKGVFDVCPVDATCVQGQIHALLIDLPIHAIKIGMLANRSIIQVIAESLTKSIGAAILQKDIHCVLDPVMVSKSGHSLLESKDVSFLIDAVIPHATILTPNLPEARILLGDRFSPDSVSDMRRAADRIRSMMTHSGSRWVLVKGGHLSGDPVDVLSDGDTMIEMAHPRISTKNTHGTGCTLSSAIAAFLSNGCNVSEAVSKAQKYTEEAIRNADALLVGNGRGPVHHFYNLWKQTSIFTKVK